MSEEDIVGLFSTSLEIFASYYTDICQNYYPAIENSEDITASASSEDPLAAALGSKLTYRPASDVPGPQVIYKEGGTPASTDFITKAIQGYGTTSSSVKKLTRTNPLRVFLLTLALITKMKFLLS